MIKKKSVRKKPRKKSDSAVLLARLNELTTLFQQFSGGTQSAFQMLFESRTQEPEALRLIRLTVQHTDIVVQNLCTQYSQLLQRCDRQDEQMQRLIRIGHAAFERQHYPSTSLVDSAERARRQKAVADKFMPKPDGDANAG